MSVPRCDWCGRSGFLHVPTHGSAELGAALCCVCTDKFMARVALLLRSEGKSAEATAGWHSWLRAHEAECGVLS